MTYVDDDGSVSVCNATSTSTYIYEYSSDLHFIKTMKFQNEFNKLGAFAKDNEWNYYLFYATDVSEGEFEKNNMALVKYDNSGNRQNIYRLNAYTVTQF